MKKAALKSVEEVGQSLAELLKLTLAFEELFNEMEQKIQAVRDQYSYRLTDLCLDKEAEEKLLKAWLKENKKEFDGPPRSKSFPAGTVGYELGQPHLELLHKKQWNWEKVLKAIKEQHYDEYIRIKEEVNKEAIMKHIAELTDVAFQEKLASALAAIGLKKAQDDKAFIRLNREEK